MAIFQYYGTASGFFISSLHSFLRLTCFMTTDNVGEQLADCFPQCYRKVTFSIKKRAKNRWRFSFDIL